MQTRALRCRGTGTENSRCDYALGRLLLLLDAPELALSAAALAAMHLSIRAACTVCGVLLSHCALCGCTCKGVCSCRTLLALAAASALGTHRLQRNEATGLHPWVAAADLRSAVHAQDNKVMNPQLYVRDSLCSGLPQLGRAVRRTGLAAAAAAWDPNAVPVLCILAEACHEMPTATHQDPLLPRVLLRPSALECLRCAQPPAVGSSPDKAGMPGLGFDWQTRTA